MLPGSEQFENSLLAMLDADGDRQQSWLLQGSALSETTIAALGFAKKRLYPAYVRFQIKGVMQTGR